MVELTHRNTRRYGGYLVHMGVVFMFIGFTGKAFDKDKTVELQPGRQRTDWRIYAAVDRLQVRRERELSLGQAGHRGYEERRQIWARWSRSGASTRHRSSRLQNVAIRRRLNEDLYLNFAGSSDDGEITVVQAYVFPLVSWIWIGYWVVLVGTLICLIPSKTRLIYPRTEVVGIAGKQRVEIESKSFES